MWWMYCAACQYACVPTLLMRVVDVAVAQLFQGKPGLCCARCGKPRPKPGTFKLHPSRSARTTGIDASPLLGWSHVTRLGFHVTGDPPACFFWGGCTTDSTTRYWVMIANPAPENVQAVATTVNGRAQKENGWLFRAPSVNEGAYCTTVPAPVWGRSSPFEQTDHCPPQKHFSPVIWDQQYRQVPENPNHCMTGTLTQPL